MKRLVLFVILVLVSCAFYGQEIAEAKRVKLQSSELGQEREIFVYTPKFYNEDKYVHYDVIYVFDSQNREFFDYVSSSVKLINPGKQFIVVGITSPYNEELDYARNNDMLPAPKNVLPPFYFGGTKGNGNKFLKYVKNEVVNYVENNYRTFQKRIAVGHSLSASLVLFSLPTEPELFDAYFAISPNFAYDKERILQEFRAFDFSKYNKKAFIYLSHANEGGNYWKSWKPARENFYDFAEKLDTNKVFYIQNDDSKRNHWTTFAPNLTDALNRYFEFEETQKTVLSNEKYKITIKLTVPNKNDKVFITGNQDALNNWNAKGVKLERISDFGRQIELEVQSPVVFKFTRGKWDAEAIVKGNPNLKNMIIKLEKDQVYFFEVQNWLDKEE